MHSCCFSTADHVRPSVDLCSDKMWRIWKQAFRSSHQRSARSPLNHRHRTVKNAHTGLSTWSSSSTFDNSKSRPFEADLAHLVQGQSVASTSSSKGASGSAIRTRFAQCRRGSPLYGLLQAETLECRRFMCNARLEKEAVVVEGKENDEIGEEVESDDNSAGDEFASLDVPDEDDFVCQFVAPSGQQEEKQVAAKELLWSKISRVGASSDQLVVPIILKWREQGRELNKGFLINYITRLRKRARYRHALKISEWLVKEKPFKTDAVDHIFRLDLTARLGHIEFAERLFRELPEDYKNATAYGTLLMNYAKWKMVKKGKLLFEEIKKLGFFKSPFVLNHMIKLYSLENSNESISRILEEAKSAGIQPDIFTYNLLMTVEAKDRNIEAMEKIWDEVKGNPSVKLDAKSHGIMASGYLMANMRDKAESALKRMEMEDYVKTPSMYNALLRMYGELGNAEEVERIWRAIKTLEKKSNYSLTCLLKAFNHLKSEKGAEEAFKDMEQLIRGKKGNAAALRCLKGLLNIYEKFGLTNKAEELRKEMHGNSGALDAVGLHTSVEEILESGDLEKALDALKSARKHSKIRPLLDTYLLVLGKLAETGDFKTAEVIFELCREDRHVKKSIVLWNTLIKAYVNARVPVYGIRQRMFADRIFPNPETQSLLKNLKQRVHNEIANR